MTFARTAAPATDPATALIFPGWRSANPLPGGKDYMAFANEGFKKNVIIFACIRERFNALSEPDLIVRQTTRTNRNAGPLPDSEVIQNTAHPLVALLDKPNPNLSQTELLQTILMHLDIFGNTYLHKVRSSVGQTIQLWPLHPSRIEIKANTSGTVESFRYKIDEKYTDIPATDIIHFKYPNPWDDFYGLSPMEVLARCGDLDNSAVDYLRAFFTNAAVPQGILKVKVGNPDKEARERIQREFGDKYAGKAGWHRPAVLTDDVDYQRIGSSLSDLDLTRIFGVSESRICSTYGVPPILIAAAVGLARSTYNNFAESRKAFWQQTLTPLYTFISDRLTAGLAEEFETDRRKIYIEFDYSDVGPLQESQDSLRGYALNCWNSGLMTKNEARSLVKLPETDNGDIFKQAQSDVFIGEDDMPGEIPPPDEEGDDTVDGELVDEKEQRKIPARSEVATRFPFRAVS